jgi:hypothetical protein
MLRLLLNKQAHYSPHKLSRHIALQWPQLFSLLRARGLAKRAMMLADRVSNAVGGSQLDQIYCSRDC